MELGILAVMQGRFDDAWTLLGEGMTLSLKSHTTSLVTLGLVAFARLTFAEGDPERAALLAGAADGLRERAGVEAWPKLRRPAADLVAQLRETLGADRFERVFAEGSGLDQQSAVAAVSDRHATGAGAS